MEEARFEVRDKRLSSTAERKEDTVKPEAEKEERKQEEPPDVTFPVTFSSFVLSLAASALIHLGQNKNTATGEAKVQLPLARQVIDLISLMEQKTKGNLTTDEEEMISQTLFMLRMKFVELEKDGGHRKGGPSS